MKAAAEILGAIRRWFPACAGITTWHKRTAGALALLMPFAAAAQTQPAPPTPAPKLLVVIAVDQFSADIFAEYRGLVRGGIARLAQGVVFPAGFQAHAATETCPGHSTILTGSHPARSGMIANNWFNLGIARTDKRIYCAEDPAVPGTESGGGKYAASVTHLLTPTLGELMKARSPASRVVAVAGKDRAAIMMAGKGADEVLWLAPGGLTSYRGTALSPMAQKASAAVAAAIAAEGKPLDLPIQCRDRDIAIALPQGGTVGTGRFARPAGNFRAFLASPQADGAVLATAAALRADRRLGEGPGTDLLIIGLSATDYVGHAFGTEGAEMCQQILSMDRDLGDFFARLDATGIDYAVALTADHGGHDLPERLVQNAIPAERVDPALEPATLGKVVAAKLGLPEPVLYGDGPFGDYYLSRALTPAQRKAALAEVRAQLTAHRQVEAVYTAEELAAHPVSRRSPELWSIKDRMRASFHPARSGDLVLALKPRVTPIPETGVGYVATHGSVWDYDRRVPMLFWRKGLAAFEQPNPVMTVDILPTLAALIGLPLDSATIDGRCLDLVAGAATSCP
jgi:phosphonoacetate hydrolase